MPSGTITLNNIPSPKASTAFPVSGTITITPSMEYKDDSGSYAALPSGSIVPSPSGVFSFTHPGLSAGSHTVYVEDTVTGASANTAINVGTTTWVFCTPGSGSFTTGGNTYSVDASGNCLENGSAMTGGGGAIGLALLNGTIRRHDGTSPYHWYQWNGSTWLSAMGSAADGTFITDGTGYMLLVTDNMVTLTGVNGQIAWNGVTDSATSNVSMALIDNSLKFYYQNVSGQWFENSTQVSGSWTQIAGDPRVTWVFISPGSGSFTDALGNTYTLDASGNCKINGTAMNGGGGTSLMALLGGSVWGQDSTTGNWYIWQASSNSFIGATVSASGATIDDGTGYLLLSNNKIVTITAGEVAFNGTADSTTSNVELLLTYNGELYYENTSSAWKVDSTNSSGAWSTTTGDPRGASGTGPVVGSGTLANVDLGVATGKTVLPQLFGASTGGLSNTSWTDCSNSTLQGYINALNLPLLRIHSGWQGSNDTFSSGQISTFISNISTMFPTSCTFVLGIQTPTLTPSVMQSFAHDTLSYWNTNAASYLPQFVECLNETDSLDRGTYNSCFSGMVAGAQQIQPTIMGAGPTDSSYKYPNGNVQSLVSSQTANTLGLLDWHTYVYDNAAGDATPTDQEVMQSAAAPNDLTKAFSSVGVQNDTAGTYAHSLPCLVGEYNIEASAWSGETRTQDHRGACFMISTLMKIASTATNPAWCAVWDLYNDAGAGYNLISQAPTLTRGAQYYTLQRLIATMPGKIVSASSQVANLAVWATQTGASDFGVAFVNSDTSNTATGTVALSNIPGSSTGTLTLYKWELSAANPNGSQTTLSVTTGNTASFSVPSEAVVIISTRS